MRRIFWRCLKDTNRYVLKASSFSFRIFSTLISFFCKKKFFLSSEYITSVILLSYVHLFTFLLFFVYGCGGYSWSKNKRQISIKADFHSLKSKRTDEVFDQPKYKAWTLSLPLKTTALVGGKIYINKQLLHNQHR